jgi:hypothetical protein
MIRRSCIAVGGLVLVAACGGRLSSQTSSAALDPASDSLTAPAVTTLPPTGTNCPSGTVHPNLCCSTTALDVTSCQGWTGDPLRACPAGTTTNPDPARCCSLEDPSQCSAPDPSEQGVPLASQCNMVCPPGTTYDGPTSPPTFALPDDVCVGPGGAVGLGPPEMVGPVTGSGPGIVSPPSDDADAGPYSAPPFDMCPVCPPGWTPDSAGDLCCRTPPGGAEECISLAYDLPGAPIESVSCTGPSDYSSCVCSDVSGGHSYAMTCAAVSGGEAYCTCHEDGATTGTFTTSSDVLDPYSGASTTAFDGAHGCGFPLGVSPGGTAGGGSAGGGATGP